MIDVEFYRSGNRVFLGHGQLGKLPTEGEIISVGDEVNAPRATVVSVLTRRSSAGTVHEIHVRA